MNARRVLDFLLVEHLRRGGSDNGRLEASHRELNGCGVGTQYIKRSIDELEARGLVAVERGGRTGGAITNLFRLTWLPMWNTGRETALLVMPTDEWRQRRT